MSLNQKNGGFLSYPDRVQKKTFFRASSRYTSKVTVKSGQVLKAYSFLKSDVDGKSVASGVADDTPLQGVLCFDVDATSGDVDASAFTSASFWQDALVWSVDILTDTIELADGSTVAVTAYDTGAAGSTEVSHLLKRKFVEGTNFQELGFLTAGEEA